MSVPYATIVIMLRVVSRARPPLSAGGAEVLRLITRQRTPVVLTVYANGRLRYSYWQYAQAGGPVVNCQVALDTKECEALREAGRIELGEPVVDRTKTTYPVRAVPVAAARARAAESERPAVTSGRPAVTERAARTGAPGSDTAAAAAGPSGTAEIQPVSETGARGAATAGTGSVRVGHQGPGSGAATGTSAVAASAVGSVPEAIPEDGYAAIGLTDVWDEWAATDELGDALDERAGRDAQDGDRERQSADTAPRRRTAALTA
ncbi:hypothetical protein OK074_7161 [Actinobacteria bacterium OK074]|nr:hypothetical protein OK074_7161 [Actinobacteria bacterium OK074]